MPLLQIKPNFITDLKSFKWGDEWRAERIWRELRGDGEYLFASLRKDYGVIEKTHALDLGNKKEDYFWVGRVENRVGERVPDVDPKSPTFGQRIYEEPATQLGSEFNETTQQWEKVEYKDGKLVYEYICPATPENLKKFRGMVGNLDNGKSTQLIFIFGSSHVDIPDHELFFKEGDTVAAYEKKHYDRLNKDPNEQMAETVATLLKANNNANPQTPKK